MNLNKLLLIMMLETKPKLISDVKYSLNLDALKTIVNNNRFKKVVKSIKLITLRP
jgi:hypothetical protein